jgi:RluA family pseudouridine synthase
LRELILFRNEDFLVVNKPAGVLSQKDKSGDEDLAALLKKSLEKAGEKIPFLAPVHRLDRNTSGLLILALHSAAARELTEIIQAGKLEKVYLALVKGNPGANGRFDFPLKKDEKTNQSFVDEDGAEAITEFTQRQFFGNSSLMEVRILTGRSHQIRAHFAAAGHALLGDRKYAKKPWSEIFPRPALHAHRLVIEGKETIKVEAPLPADMQEMVKKLGATVVRG